MVTILTRAAACGLLMAAVPGLAGAQTFDALGTRAAGMSGAFVAVSDDASAAYWNPGGFASGSFFSLAIDRLSASAEPDGVDRGGSQSGWLLALGAPSLGLSYYRLRGTGVTPAVPAGVPIGVRNTTEEDALQVRSLVSHHLGATLVQSVVPGVAVGATLKLVRGIAAFDVRPAADRDDLLDEGSSQTGRASNRFDLDVGVMATLGRLKAGLTVRNVSEPSFETPGGGAALTLDRQARAGVAVGLYDGWLVAADVDLLRSRSLTGTDQRDLALGAEGRIGRRAFVRAGTRFNTIDHIEAGRAATASLGGSFAVLGSVLVDAQVTSGSRWSGRGWGIAVRLVY